MACDPQSAATEWLSSLTFAINSGEALQVSKLFLPTAGCAIFLSLPGTTVPIPATPDVGVELAFTFECRHGHARAHARLLRDPNGAFKALSLFVDLADLAGYEEVPTMPLRDDLTGTGRDMQTEFEDWVQEVETEPYVLIVGAGQTGLNIAARLKQMKIRALVIDRNARIGDTWRNRYPTLTLHTIKRHHTLLYHPYPDNWPEYTPRDKLADWLELYATIQDLVVWTSAEFKGRPTYDHDSKDWDVTVIREGFEVKLRPAHIILATGTLGEPNVPDVPGMEHFAGEVLHSHEFPGAAPFVGKRVIVVGAGNSSIDVCQDLVLRGAQAVTMIQRSSTCVMSRDYIGRMQRAGFPEGIPLDVADFKFSSFPLGLLRKLMIADQQSAWDAEKELHDKLRKGGVKLNMGPEGQGLPILVTERGTGYWLDKGGADLIAEGKIRVKSGISVDKFTEQSVLLSDGSELEADAVIFATGYTNMRDSNAELFGEEVIRQTDQVYGIDEEGEIRGSYRPSGYPGLWFASGDFYVSRTMSKPLAIQLKAIQLGLLEHNGRRDGATDIGV
ncbi:dimethylaniline monooxygenase (N-oxide-forming) [Fomes fomentarius]|nr:dimethylaniline monooxygenase (N-oxide-forming) [Fomes fomentarius]